MDNLFVGEIGREELRYNEVDNIVIVDGENVRHLAECLTLPKLIELALDN